MKNCFMWKHHGHTVPCHFGCTDVCQIGLSRANNRESGPFLANFVASLNPVAWYRMGVGMSAAAWVDQVVGGAQNFVQTEAANQLTPTAYGSMLADGVDNYMTATFTLAQPYTIYGLVNQVTWTGTDRILTGSAAIINQAVATPQVRFNAGANLSNISPVVNAVNIVTVVGNGASSLIQLNNEAPNSGDAGTGAFSNPFLAASAAPALFGNTDNYEWIFYSGAHDAGQRAKVIAYLAQVGNLTI